MYKAIIIDDESHVREAIQTLLKVKVSSIEVVAEADTVKSALQALEKNDCDLIFLDIDLPDGTGFDILQQIEYKKYRIIFITAYHEYAIQAIQFSAMDYILKPVNPTDLLHAVHKSLEEIKEGNLEQKMATLISNMAEPRNQLKKIVLKTADRIHVLEARSIIRCEADNVYTSFFLESGNRIVVSKSIKHYSEMLEPIGFMRVHQSHLINLDFISCYSRSDGGFLVMTDQSEVPVSGKKKALLLEYLDGLEG